MEKFTHLIASLQNHAKLFPEEGEYVQKTIDWILKHREFAFIKGNLEGHITGSMMITNPSRTRVLLMLHKKFQRWQQFGGHCDGEIDVRSVALREFHEESGIVVEPDLLGDIFMVDVHYIPVDKKGTKEHYHFDIMYLATIPDDIVFMRQESEVDDIRWFDIEGIEEFVEEDMLTRIQKIQYFN